MHSGKRIGSGDAYIFLRKSFFLNGFNTKILKRVRAISGLSGKDTCSNPDNLNLIPRAHTVEGGSHTGYILISFTHKPSPPVWP